MREGELVFNEHRIYVWDDRRVLGVDSGDEVPAS